MAASSASAAPALSTAPEGEARVGARATVGVWLEKVREELYGSVLPFWLRHSPDREFGGYFNCLDRDGRPFDTRKHVWLQGREAWMMARLANEASEEHVRAMMDRFVPARDAASEVADKAALAVPDASRTALVAVSKLGVDFLRKNAIHRENGHVYFALTRDGTPALIQRKPFSATFMIMAVAEFARAARDDALREEALRLVDLVLEWVRTPGALGRPVLEGDLNLSPLNVPMILLNIFMELSRDLSPADRAHFYRSQREWCVAEILKHVRPELKMVLENIGADGSPDLSSPDGRLCNPGHAIEAGWFLLDCALAFGDEALKATALEVIEWSFEIGWDREKGGGGLLYFVDAKGYSPTQLEWDMKLWWPHCEALIAYAMAFNATLETKYLDRFVQVAEWTWAHFPDPAFGEWFGYLNRDGERTHRFKGGPYKGCFHVPRALFMCETLLAAAFDKLA